MRDSFKRTTSLILRDRVTGICSNPKCRRVTVGPAHDLGVLCIGEAAHITAASPGGPRYDSQLSALERRGLDNGIWLCRTCHGLVDHDAEGFPTELLRSWKSEAEAIAHLKVANPVGELVGVDPYLTLRGSELSSCLRFKGVADPVEESVATVVAASGAVDIVYSERIEEALASLQQRDRDPDGHMARNPYRSEIELRQRGATGAYHHAQNKSLLRRASLIAEHNSVGIHRLLGILDELNASTPEKKSSVSTFGALAALRMVHVLKNGYTWDETGVYPWFEALEVGTTSAPGLLPLVPMESHTGYATFGFRFWCVARVGLENVYEYAMFPYKKVLPLFLNGIQGDRAAFFEWVLPQIFDSSRLTLRRASNKISVRNWEAFYLVGSQGDWGNTLQDCPWGYITE